MSQIADWAKYVSKREKEIADQIETVKISSSDDKPTEREPTKDHAVLEQCSLAEARLVAKVIRKGLITGKNDVEVLRKDQNTALDSFGSFDAFNLKPNLLKGVYEMGFNAPTKFQETALQILLAEPSLNLIAQSQSGIGQREAFVLVMLSKVDINKKYLQVLCLSPTYEFAIQTGDVAARMAKFCPEIQMKLAVRGEEVSRNSKLTDHIIIGTPGKVIDWFLKIRVFDLKKISVFVVDKADVLISTQGHQDQFMKIHKNLSSTCQMMFFLETYDQELVDFAEHIVKNPITIKWKREE